MPEQGFLYIVATPIGNLSDISDRAKNILQSVDKIAAEDTRHSGTLLKAFGILTPMVAYHDHNETSQAARILDDLREGKSIALISDAGTPLVSDPGFSLVNMALEAGIRVIPIPGACALISALCASGLPAAPFLFCGFLAAKSNARKKELESLVHHSATLIFYEAPHRILDTIEDMLAVFSGDRIGVIARELTKIHETIFRGSLSAIHDFLKSNSKQCLGEFVILIQGEQAKSAPEAISPEMERIAKLLAKELPPRKTAALTAEITGGNKNNIYDYLMRNK